MRNIRIYEWRIRNLSATYVLLARCAMPFREISLRTGNPEKLHRGPYRVVRNFQSATCMDWYQQFRITVRGTFADIRRLQVALGCLPRYAIIFTSILNTGYIEIKYSRFGSNRVRRFPRKAIAHSLSRTPRVLFLKARNAWNIHWGFGYSTTFAGSTFRISSIVVGTTCSQKGSGMSCQRAETLLENIMDDKRQQLA